MSEPPSAVVFVQFKSEGVFLLADTVLRESPKVVVARTLFASTDHDVEALAEGTWARLRAEEGLHVRGTGRLTLRQEGEGEREGLLVYAECVAIAPFPAASGVIVKQVLQTTWEEGATLQVEDEG